MPTAKMLARMVLSDEQYEKRLRALGKPGLDCGMIIAMLESLRGSDRAGLALCRRASAIADGMPTRVQPEEELAW